MQFGISWWVTDDSMPITELARALEAAGFESLFLAEHTHIPTSRRTPWPLGGELPRHYSRTLDPFAALAAAASVTHQLKLGTGVCLVPERHPILLAKEVATLDHLSHGRFVFGVGAGWNVEELEHHGVDPARRWALLGESIRAMKAIWTQEAAEYHGQLVAFESLWSWPKPVQQPHPPVLLGGSGPNVLRRVVEYADGWMPIGAQEGDGLASRVARLQELARAAGRPPIPVTVTGLGLADLRHVERYARAGVSRMVLSAPPGRTEEVMLPFLAQYAEAITVVA